MSAKKVALAWAEGRRLKSGNIRTDGRRLWSWGLVIGVTKDGCKCALDYRGKVSGSTTRHVNIAMKHATTFEEGQR